MGHARVTNKLITDSHHISHPSHLKILPSPRYRTANTGLPSAMSIVTVDLIFNQGPRIEIHRLESRWHQRESDLIINMLEQINKQDPTDPCHNPLEIQAGQRVYRGRLKEYPSALNAFQPPEQEVAVKLAIGQKDVNNCLHEALIYRTALAPLQGKVVPVFHGLFEGQIRTTNAVCIILEWCGETFGGLKPDDIR